jgi:hypothetical protein
LRNAGYLIAVLIRAAYLRANGGQPDPYVIENSRVDTVVSEFLSLTTGEGLSSPEAYASLIQKKGLAPPNFFPFAVEGGGDFFFVDLNTSTADVYIYTADAEPGEELQSLGLGLDEFWSSLKPE